MLWCVVSGESGEEAVYAADYQFGLSPAGAHHRHIAAGMSQSIIQQQSSDDLGFPGLSAPSGGHKLVVSELLYEVLLVFCGLKAQGIPAEAGWGLEDYL